MLSFARPVLRATAGGRCFSSELFLPLHVSSSGSVTPLGPDKNMSLLPAARCVSLGLVESENTLRASSTFLLRHLGVTYRAFPLAASTTGEPASADPMMFRKLFLKAWVSAEEGASLLDWTLLAKARAYIGFQHTHRFCGTCGGQVNINRENNRGTCLRCKAEIFPRVDPVAIMLVTDERRQRVLLGEHHHRPHYTTRTLTALAGFVEPGETLESTVVREVFEEAGVRVRDDSVRFLRSQSWPMNSNCQLMLAFEGTAEACGDGEEPPISVDKEELVSAEWIGVDDLRLAVQQQRWAGGKGRGLPSPFHLPPPGTIAHHMLLGFLGSGAND